jgi:hypothetical protein
LRIIRPAAGFGVEGALVLPKSNPILKARRSTAGELAADPGARRSSPEEEPMRGLSRSAHRTIQALALAGVVALAAALPLKPAAAGGYGGSVYFYGTPGYGYAAPGYGYASPGYGYAPNYYAPNYYAPSYYAPSYYYRPYYYAPPPVYYAPPPVYYAPPALGFGVTIPFGHRY